MKKSLALIMAVLLALCLPGCQGSSEFPEEDMKTSYLDQFYPNSDIKPNELEIESYGTYDGCTVAYIHGPFAYLTWLENETVGSYVFKYSSSQKLLAYMDGVYKSMADAYADGWLDDAAVKEILEKHKQEKSFLYND